MPPAGTLPTDPWITLADELWRALEPYHATVYFAPEHRAACDGIGLRGGWMAYFASRAAPLGAVPAPVVAAVFYNFHPAMVARAIPDAWGFASPGTVLQARSRSVLAGLSRILGDLAEGEPIRRAAEVARRIAGMAAPAGRPLYAANLALDWPEHPVLALWHAATLLREHRGDGHVAVLTAEQVDGCQAHVLQVAAGRVPREGIQPYRGWSDDDWQAATEGLVERGWLDGGGALTPEGRRGKRSLEQRTSRLAAAPLHAAGRETVETLLGVLPPILERLRADGAVPYPNPIGLPVGDTAR